MTKRVYYFNYEFIPYIIHKKRTSWVVIFLEYKTKNNDGLEQVAYNDNLSSMILLKIAQSNSQAGLECLAITCLPQISGDDAWHHVACVSTSRSLLL